MGRVLRDKGKTRERWEHRPGSGEPLDPHVDRARDEDDQSVAGEEDPGSADDTLLKKPGRNQLARRL